MTPRHLQTPRSGPGSWLGPVGVAGLAAALVCGAPASTSAQGAAPAPAPAAAGEPAPRWPDGRVNLGSAAGKKGYWEVRPGLGGFPRAADVPFQPWARAVYDYRTATVELYPPLVHCKPTPGPSFFNAPGFELVDVPELQRVFILNIAGPHSWRVIYTDGRPHPAGPDVRPTFLGHSVGRWEGDTLVVESTNFNEKFWLGSYPTTEKLRITERFSRPSLTSLAYEFTIDDPGAYTKPWGGRFQITEKSASKWIPDGEVFEYICQDDRDN